MSANRSPLPRPGYLKTVYSAFSNQSPRYGATQLPGPTTSYGSAPAGTRNSAVPDYINDALDWASTDSEMDRANLEAVTAASAGQGGQGGQGRGQGGQGRGQGRGQGGQGRGQGGQGRGQGGQNAAMPSKADALRNAGFSGLGELEAMQEAKRQGLPPGSSSALSGPGSRRMITSPARSLERQARRYAKFGDAGRAAASQMMSQAAQIRAGEPSLRTEAGIERDQARDTAAGNLAQGVINRLSGDEQRRLTSGGRPLQGQGRRVGS
jgi:hypothetical protein